MSLDDREGVFIASPDGRNDRLIFPSDDSGLLADLATAEGANVHGRSCQVCDALDAMSDQAKSGVLRALAGTIGEEKLAAILTRNGYPTGRRAVKRHRREDHTP